MRSMKSIYKIGHGPSSSHTVGPYRAAKIIGKRYPEADAFLVTLYGSLAFTGEGHGTGKASCSGLPGAKIVNDNFRGGYEATRHLIEKGYRKIGMLAGYMNTDLYRERLRGYKQALLDAGRPVDEDIIFLDTIVRETGFENGLKAIDKGCDALYSAGDFSALGAIEAARERGLRCPDRFGIVGTANEIFDALMSPSMSSLELHPDILGQLAARSFLEAVRTGGEPSSATVEVNLKVRESSSGFR